MKWLGQYIQDFTARFRNDVYLENISSGTIASGGNLGLDSDNKIVKQSDTGITDLHGAGVDGSANQLLTDDGDGTITSEPNLTWDGNDLNIASVSAGKPVVEIKTTIDEATGSFLNFVKDKGAAGADEDVIATINFTGDNAAQEQTSFGRIRSYIGTAADTDEAGIMDFGVATSDGSTSTLQNGLTLTGESGSGVTPGKVNATIGAGSTSTTAVAGSLSVGSSVSAISRTGEIQVASQPSITTLAGLTTIGATGVNTVINSDDVQMYNAVNNGNPQLSIGSGAAERLVIWPQYDSGAQTLNFVKFGTYTADGSANAGYFNFDVDEVSILNIKDSGISLNTGFGIDINGDDIITDSSGTATLSNIDALDATTAATIQDNQVMHFEFKGYSTGDGSNFVRQQGLTDGQAPFEHNTSCGSDGLDATDVSELFRTGGTVMTRSGTIKRIVGWATGSGSSATCQIQFVKATHARNDNTNVTPVLLENWSFTSLGNDNMEDFDETSFTQASVTKGDIIYTQIKTSGSGVVVYFNATMEIEF